LLLLIALLQMVIMAMLLLRALREVMIHGGRRHGSKGRLGLPLSGAGSLLLLLLLMMMHAAVLLPLPFCLVVLLFVGVPPLLLELAVILYACRQGRCIRVERQSATLIVLRLIVHHPLTLTEQGYCNIILMRGCSRACTQQAREEEERSDDEE